MLPSETRCDARLLVSALLDHVAPGLTPRMDWLGEIARNTAPPGFAPPGSA